MWEKDGGSCRAKPPVVVHQKKFDAPYFVSIWPETNPDDWCWCGMNIKNVKVTSGKLIDKSFLRDFFNLD